MDASADKSILEEEAGASGNKFVKSTNNINLNFIARIFAFLRKKASNVITIGSSARSYAFGSPEVERFRLNYNGDGGNYMSETTLQLAQLYIPFSHAVAWLSLEEYVGQYEVREKSHFCLDYCKSAEDKIVHWIEINRANFSHWNRPLMGITVFARFDDLAPGESVRLTRLFGNAGGVLNNYPQFAREFIEAVSIFNYEIAGARSRAKNYKERRKKLTTEPSATV